MWHSSTWKCWKDVHRSKTDIILFGNASLPWLSGCWKNPRWTGCWIIVAASNQIIVYMNILQPRKCWSQSFLIRRVWVLRLSDWALVNEPGCLKVTFFGRTMSKLLPMTKNNKRWLCDHEEIDFSWFPLNCSCISGYHATLEYKSK